MITAAGHAARGDVTVAAVDATKGPKLGSDGDDSKDMEELEDYAPTESSSASLLGNTSAVARRQYEAMKRITKLKAAHRHARINKARKQK